MKKIIFGAFASAVLLCGEMAVSAQTYIAEQVVAVVGSSMVLLSEVEETMKIMAEQRRRAGYTSDADPRGEALELNMIRRLLSRQADIDSLPVNSRGISSAIESSIESLVTSYGSVQAVEKAYNKRIDQISNELELQYGEIQKAMDMEEKIRGGVSVNPSEVERFYRTVNRDSLPTIPEQYMYSHIVVRPASSEAARLRARERLLELRQRIMEGARFSTLALAYSVDQQTRVKGGELEPGVKEQFQPEFGNALEKLIPGNISEVVETEDGFHLIELLEVVGDQYRARHILVRPEFTDEEINETAQRLDSIAGEIMKGDLSFADAARQYSEDRISRLNGGRASNSEIAEMHLISPEQTSMKFYAESMQPADYLAIRDLKPGEISKAYRSVDLRGNDIVKIVKLDEVVPAHRANIRDDYEFIEQIALETKKNNVYDKWIREHIQSVYVRIDPSFENCDFQYEGWVKRDVR